MREHRIKLLAIGTGALLILFVPLIARAVKPISPPPPAKFVQTDFARGILVETTSNDALHEIWLPLAVYQGLRRPDRTDIRVFNHDGQAVPFVVQTVDDFSEQQVKSLELPLFPIWGEANQTAGHVNLKLVQNAQGTLIDVKSLTIAGQRQDKATVIGYILDATAALDPITSLAFSWSDEDPSFVREVRLESSSDMEHWDSLGPAFTLSRFTHQGKTLVRDRVNLNLTNAKYLRLSWSESSKPITLTAVSAELVSRSTTPSEPVWQEALSSADPLTKGGYIFDTGGTYPISRVRLRLPENNTVVRVRLSSAKKPDGPWQTRFSGVLYNMILDGREVTSPDIDFSPSSDRLFRLIVEQKEGGLGEGIPLFKFMWEAERLVFLAQGAGPFVLAFGNHVAGRMDFDLNGLLGKSQTPVKTAKLGPAFDIKKPEPPAPPPRQTRKGVLWAVMGVALTVLGGMAYQLLRQMKNNKTGGPI